MTLLDLKSKEEWGEIVARFAQEAKMTACLTDDTGGKPQCYFDRYPLCGAIRDDQESTTFICSQTNTVMLAMVKKTMEPEIDICEAGLVRLVVPILRNGRLIGQVFACGLASEQEDLNSFLIAKQLNVPEEKVLELAKSTPFGSEEKLKQLADRLFSELNPQETADGRLEK
ncbi:MAG: PocR ligand-binding domain-containing protein [Deltaproteobacteria bacterium]|nr:PocR ligand-binding domain-containing protein [Deltaproteobacteria bacterium]